MYDIRYAPRGKRPSMTRLTLTTEDIATIFNVKPDTVRHWISNGKLTLTGDVVKDFKHIAALWSAHEHKTTTE